jgi:aspartate racemase
MKTIGLIGGMSWESTVTYYQAINQGIKNHLGGLHSAKIILISVDFAEIETLQHHDQWFAAGEVLVDAAKRLELAGADAFMICTNTMHKVVDQVQAAVSIPNLHIAEQTALSLLKDNVTKVGLLGTAFTMEQAFYRERLERQGIEVVIPVKEDCDQVHQIIYQELCLGDIYPKSQKIYTTVVNELLNQGAQAVILGCTEIGLLLKQEHSSIPLYDTTAIHAEAAVEFILS